MSSFGKFLETQDRLSRRGEATTSASRVRFRYSMFALVSAALALQPGQAGLSRRDLLRFGTGATAAALMPAAVANAVSARTGASSVFTGEYDDPKHPGCLRSVKVVGAKLGADGRKERTPTAQVKGVDQTPGLQNACEGTPELANVWKLEGKVSEAGDTITVDFSPKTQGRVGKLVGTYDNFGGAEGILWPDGNKWTKVPGGTPSRRPPLATLNSGD